MAYTFDGIVFGFKKNGILTHDTYGMDEARGHHVK